jgi:hypothetical protein
MSCARDASEATVKLLKLGLMTSLSPACALPQAILQTNRDHWGIEIIHRNKNVFLGEDG